MVDLSTCSPASPGAERSKIKSLMGRTPGIGILKSKFLTVLGNSNELLNGISNKLTLSISSSDSDYCDDDEEDLPKFDETIDYTKIDFEFRRVKARRAHEEIISGRFRYPNFVPKSHLEVTRTKADGKLKHSRSISSSSSSSSTTSSSSHSLAIDRSQVSSTTRSNSLESRNSGGYGRPGRAIAGARRSDLDIQKDLMTINDVLKTSVAPPYIDVQEPSERQFATFPEHRSFSSHLNNDSLNMISTTSVTSMRVPARSKTSNSSTLTSLRDDPEEQVSPSVESTDWNFIRSESQNSVPSWASSISLDCRAGEEPAKEFMKKFTDVLFINATAISLEFKSEFGALARLEIGRQSFTRFLLEQRSKSKRVSEATFHSLVQYFAIMLFECSECEDYTPAAIIMNLCFLFYHEIEVPGCDPYREYLFIYMRQQPIWQTLRFWNGAFFEAMHGELEHRLALKKKRADRRQRNNIPVISNIETANIVHSTDNVVLKEERPAGITVQEVSSSSSSHRSNAPIISNKTKIKKLNLNIDSADREHHNDIRIQENIAFRQLGVFTCNMHALGISQDICLEFLKKQSASASLSLSKEKIKLIKDNIHRMYHETELWGAKEL